MSMKSQFTTLERRVASLETTVRLQQQIIDRLATATAGHQRIIEAVQGVKPSAPKKSVN